MSDQAVLRIGISLAANDSRLSSKGLPFQVVVRPIPIHCRIRHNGGDQSDKVDNKTSQDHERGVAGTCAPGLVCSSRLIIAEVHVCDGVGMGWRKAFEKCRNRSLE